MTKLLLAAIAAAHTLTLPAGPAAKEIHVTGTSTIVYITPCHPVQWGCMKKLVADGPWTMSDNGDVATPVFVHTGDEVILYYDPEGKLWYPTVITHKSRK